MHNTLKETLDFAPVASNVSADPEEPVTPNSSGPYTKSVVEPAILPEKLHEAGEVHSHRASSSSLPSVSSSSLSSGSGLPSSASSTLPLNMSSSSSSAISLVSIWMDLMAFLTRCSLDRLLVNQIVFN